MTPEARFDRKFYIGLVGFWFALDMGLLAVLLIALEAQL